MLTTGGGQGIPSAHFRTVVSLFDQVNSHLENKKVNKGDGYVSPLAAEILLHHFAPVGDEEVAVDDDITAIAKAVDVYVEPSDEALAQDWLTSMKAPAPEKVDELAEQGDPNAQHLKGLRG
jgi:hypothetical protein